MLENLRWRYATKKFDPDFVVPDASVDFLIEAARLTASSFGLQPYKLMVIKDKALRQKLIEHSWGQDKVMNSSHLLLLVTHKNIDETMVNQHLDLVREVQKIPAEKLSGYKEMMMGFIHNFTVEQRQQWAKHQSYIALGNLLTVLAEMKIDSCPMEGFVAAEYDKILGLDKMGLTATLALPIGKRASDDTYAPLHKVRKAKDNFVILR